MESQRLGSSAHWLQVARPRVLSSPTPNHRASKSSLSLDPAPASPAPRHCALEFPLSHDPSLQSPKPRALQPQQQATAPQISCCLSIRPSGLRASVLPTPDHNFSVTLSLSMQSLVLYPTPHPSTGPMILTVPDVPEFSSPAPLRPLSCVPSTSPQLLQAPAVPGSSHRSPQARRLALLTGDSSSCCRGSRRPAPGSRAVARLLPGTGRGNRWPAPNRTSSSTPMVTAKRASFCAVCPRGPGVPGAGDNKACPGRLDRSCGPRLERREPAGDGVKAGSEVEVVWGSPTPLQDRLFKFSEVGSAQLKGAWVFLFNPQRSRAEEAYTKLGAPQEAHPSEHQILHPRGP